MLTQHMRELILVTPIMSKEFFSEKSGLREGQIRGQIERKNLSVFKVGRETAINLADIALQSEGAVTIQCPTMTPDHFSMVSGISPAQIKAHLPTVQVGRLIMVDIAALYRLCLAESPTLNDIN